MFKSTTAVFALAFVRVLAAQSNDRALPFTRDIAEKESGCIGRMIRGVSGAAASPDAVRHVLNVQGTPGQLAIAEWMFRELDRPPLAREPLSREFLPPDSTDIVKLFYPAHMLRPQSLTEAVTAIRTVGHTQEAFSCESPEAIAIRGTAAQTAVAEWIFTELDRAAAPDQLAGQHNASVHKFLATDGREREPGRPESRDDAVRVLYSAHINTPQAMTEIITALRTISDVAMIYPFMTAKAVILRGSEQGSALAEWAFYKLDQPPGGGDSIPDEWNTPEYDAYWVRPLTGNIAKVFYVPTSTTAEDLASLVRRIRTTVQIQRAYPCFAPRAFILRATSEQISEVERILRETP